MAAFRRPILKLVFAATAESGVWVPGHQRAIAEAFRSLAAFVDETLDSSKKILRGFSDAGTIEFLYPANHRVLAYVRALGNETILVVNNLSSAAQAVELDLKAYRGNILMEMFGRNIFPRIGDLPYLLTMGPYQFYWFRLRKV